MSNQRVNVTSPVGRIVLGNLYTPNTKDADGKPLVVKTGPNAGQPRTNFFFALAIPKGQEQHWAQTAWGQKIWAVGNASFPQAAQSPAFAWKVEDGDSTVPNKKGRKPCDNEGWRGNWILKFSGGFAPKVYKLENGAYVQVMDEGFIKPGYFVQVAFSVDGNGSQQTPGVYLNHSMVCFSGYGQEIVFGPDVNEAGFGQAPLPAGASMTPLAATAPMPGAPAPPVPPVATMPPAPPIPVTPNPQFLQMPAASGAASPSIPVVPLPSAPPPSSGPQMTAKAAGASYQAFIAAGWTDANLIAQGYMTA